MAETPRHGTEPIVIILGVTVGSLARCAPAAMVAVGGRDIPSAIGWGRFGGRRVFVFLRNALTYDGSSGWRIEMGLLDFLSKQSGELKQRRELPPHRD